MYTFDSNSEVDLFGLLNEFAIAGYGSVLHAKDGLSAHELIQNAYGYVIMALLKTESLALLELIQIWLFKKI